MADSYHSLGHNLSPPVNSDDTTYCGGRSSGLHQSSTEHLLPLRFNTRDVLVDETSLNEDGSIPMRQFKAKSNFSAYHRGSVGVSEEFSSNAQWRPGFWTRLPFLGIFALLMVLCCGYNFTLGLVDLIITPHRYGGSSHHRYCEQQKGRRKLGIQAFCIVLNCLGCNEPPSLIRLSRRSGHLLLEKLFARLLCK
jgi:hypothetical protein